MRRLRREFQEASLLLNDIPAWVVSVFAASCIAMNLLANKSLNVPWEWLAVDGGILFSWISFMCMDIIVKRYGAKAAITISMLALLINLFYAGLFFVAARVAGQWGESFSVNESAIVNNALDNTFAGAPYVLLGSSVAFAVSAIVNAFCNQAIGKLCKKDNFISFAMRSYVSTIIAQFIDNFTFAMIVSINFFGWSMTQCITCSVLGAMLELLMEVIFSPIGYRITKNWARRRIGYRYRKEYTSLEAVEA